MPKRGDSKGQKKASLYNLSQGGVRTEHREAYANELTGESDRAAALIVAADVESALVWILMFSFTRVTEEEREAIFFGHNAPLGTFADRIAIAYGLGLIFKDEREDLDRIRRIRNAFAHSANPLAFNEELIAKECARLCYRDHYGDGPEYQEPRFRYIMAALELRNLFSDRIIAKVKYSASASPDEELRKKRLGEIEAILKRDT